MRRTWFIPVILLGTCGTCVLAPAIRQGYRRGTGATQEAPGQAQGAGRAETPDLRTGIAPGELVAICERRVKARLKAPDTAEFPGLLSGFEPPASNPGTGGHHTINLAPPTLRW